MLFFLINRLTFCFEFYIKCFSFFMIGYCSHLYNSILLRPGLTSPGRCVSDVRYKTDILWRVQMGATCISLISLISHSTKQIMFHVLGMYLITLNYYRRRNFLLYVKLFSHVLNLHFIRQKFVFIFLTRLFICLGRNISCSQ